MFGYGVGNDSWILPENFTYVIIVDDNVVDILYIHIVTVLHYTVFRLNGI